MDKQVCVTAGKTAGSVVRGASNLTESVRKGTSVISQTLVSTCKATGQILQEVSLKIGNLCSRVKTDSHFAYWENKQKETFHKFGQEIFRLTESGETNVLESKNIKELLEEARNCEKEMQKIKDEMAVQRQKMELAITLKRAETDLKSTDPRIRRVAIRVLERVGVKEAIPYLTGALNDPDMEVRTRASDVMHKLINATGESVQQAENAEQVKTETAEPQQKAPCAETGPIVNNVSSGAPHNPEKTGA